MHEALLEVRDLKVSFSDRRGEVRAVRGISFEVRRGEVLGIVGESGSGKSVTAQAIMGLLKQNGRIAGGDIRFRGESLPEKSEAAMRKLRGRDIAMIFQDPMTSLNPVLPIGRQISDIIRRHLKTSKAEAEARATGMLEMVGIAGAKERYGSYPHEFSGGMRQRVMISMALSCHPELLIADEPTTALDVTIQAEILKLLLDLKEQMGTSVLLITHDLGVVANTCSRVIVMYSGLIMEEGRVGDIFHRPLHPYTRGLLESLPEPRGLEKRRLLPIPGSPPDPGETIPGCPFAARCRHAMAICRERQPDYYEGFAGHRAMCWLLAGDADKKGGAGDGR